MPSYLTTAQRALRYLAPGNKVKDLDDGLKALAEDVDADLAELDTANHIKSYGKSVVTPSQSVTNTGDYVLMPTPDKVTIVLPQDGLLAIAFHGVWAFTSSGTGRAAIFIGTNQLKYVGSGNGFGGLSYGSQFADLGASPAGVDRPLMSASMGLVSFAGSTTDAYGGGLTTGQVLGVSTRTDTAVGSAPAFPVGVHSFGVCYAFAAAGTYDVSVRFWGNVAARTRRLWVWAMK